MIPVWTYLPEYEKEREKIHAAVERVFKSGRLILGQSVENFEREFAAYCGLKYGVGVNNGTDALFIAMKALGIGAKDEVITVPNTAIPTVSSICASGATPVFVDADAQTLLMDTGKIEEKITKKTKCILPVHLYGQCCSMDAVQKVAKKHSLYVLEDCAQAHGAEWKGKKAGSMSDIAAFSFYPTKTLGGYGDGGMVVTNSKELADKARSLRMYGMIGGEYYAHMHGYNTRLDEVQAEILRFKLTKLEGYIKKRKEIAERYRQALGGTSLRFQLIRPDASSSYYLFVCMHKKRDEILEKMKEEGILLNVSYKYPIHLMEAYRYLGHKEGDFPVTEKICKEIFSLPMYPELTREEQEKVISVLKRIID